MFKFQLKRRHLRKLRKLTSPAAAFVTVLAFVASLVWGSGVSMPAQADAPTVASVSSVSLAAADRTTYSASTGGGSWAAGTVSSLAASSTNVFVCGDIVTYFTKIVVPNSSNTVTTTPLDATLVLTFPQGVAGTTSGKGVALTPLTTASTLSPSADRTVSPNTNTAAVSSTPTIASSGAKYASGSTKSLTVKLSNLPKGSTTVVRTDAQIDCQSSSSQPVATGNLSVALTSLAVTAHGVTTSPETITVGSQSVALSSVSNIQLQNPSLSLTKTQTGTAPTAAGNVINYSIVATNNGNIPLDGVTVTDANASNLSCTPTMPATLAVGASVTCTANHTLTQAEVDGGSYDNTANVTSTTGSLSVNSSKVTTTITANPNLSVVTTGALSTDKKQIDYTVTVTNSGNVTLSHVNLGDTAATLGTCATRTTLAPGASFSCTATHVLTQSEIDAGTYSNTPVATATTGSLSVNSNTVTTTIPAIRAISLSNSGVLSADGSQITYTLTATNNGNVTLTGVQISDAGATLDTCTAVSLAPGASKSCTAVHVLTQAEIDGGTFSNFGHVVTTTGALSVNSNTVVTTIAANPSLSFTNTGVLSADLSTITYTLTATNNGNVTINGVRITDLGLTLVGTCATVSLAPGQHLSCTYTYAVTQADIDAGTTSNTGRVSSTTGSLLLNSNTETTTLPSTSTLGLVKTQTSLNPSKAGDVVTWTIVATNNGTKTLRNIAILDSSATIDALACSTNTLLKGDSLTCYASRTMTQADINAGNFNNQAAATSSTLGTSTGSNVVTTSITRAVNVRMSSFSAALSADGKRIHYSYTVTNRSNITIHGVNVASTGATEDCVVQTLEPGESYSCSADHELSQDEIDSGSYKNHAGVSDNHEYCSSPEYSPSSTSSEESGGTGNNGNGNNKPNDSNDNDQNDDYGHDCSGGDDDDHDIVTPIPQNPGLDVVKSGTLSADSTEINYTITVTNIGNVSLNGVALADSGAVLGTCLPHLLLPGQTFTCSATHVLTQAQIDLGYYDNTASASSSAPAASANSNTVTTWITAHPELTIDKHGALSDDKSQVDYVITATNSGNVTLHGVHISDAGAVLGTCPDQDLLPGASFSCTAVHVLTQGQIDSGSYRNVAHGSSTSPSTSDDSDPVDTSIEEHKGLSLYKTGTLSNDKTQISYTITATNSGNVTLYGVHISDVDATLGTCNDRTLAPGQSFSCSATHVLTQDEIDFGSYTNIAHVASDSPSTSADSNEVVTPVTNDPLMSLVKTGTLADDGKSINYTITATNNGKVTLRNVTISDANAVVGVCPPTNVAPGASLVCSATHVLTQAEIDSGAYSNTASAVADNNAHEHSDDRVSRNSNEVITPIVASPSMSVDKSHTLSGDGTQILYTITVSNTGNVTLHDVTITDTRATLDTPCTPHTLAPAASFSCTAVHTITQADIDAGSYSNTAHASSPTGNLDENSNEDVTDFEQSPALEITKTQTSTGASQAGNVITYDLVVTNTGNVTLQGVTVTDSAASIDSPCTVHNNFAPGATFTCTARHTLTQDDVDAGHYANTAHVGGNFGDATPSDDSNEVDTTITASPALDIAKSQTSSGAAYPGDVITYSLVVTNTGNVTLQGVTVTDSYASIDSPCTVHNNFAPGATFTCTARHTLTQADVDAGHYANTAHVGGNFGDATPSDDSNEVDTTITAQPDLQITKTQTSYGAAAAGDVIEYTLTVTNNGNITLAGVTITDTLATTLLDGEGNSCPTVSLASLETLTCYATHTLTQDEVNNLTFTNTASVTNTTDNTVTDEASETTEIGANYSMTVTKTQTSADPNQAGDVIEYSITVRNVGAQSLTNVSVADLGTNISGANCPTVTTLVPGAHFDCVVSHTVTQADADAGVYYNTAHALATGGTNPVTEDSNEVETPIHTFAQLSVIKSQTSANPNAAGQLITWSIVVTNTGTKTATNVTITDAGTNLNGTNCAPVASLTPSSTMSCTVSHTVTQAEVDAGVYRNTAHVDASAGVQALSEDSNEVTTPISGSAQLAVVKGQTSVNPQFVGDVITWNIVVTNTGTKTLANAALADVNAALINCPAIAQLLPGQSFNCSASHTVTAADQAAGQYSNNAVASSNTGGLNITSNTVTTPFTPVVRGLVLATSATQRLTTESAELTATPSIGGGTINYFVRSSDNNCSLIGRTVTAPSAGTCVLGSTISALYNLNAATSNDVTIVFTAPVLVAPQSTPTVNTASTTTTTDPGNAPIAGFAPGAGVRIEVIGARTTGQFVVTPNSAADLLGLAAAIQESSSRNAQSFAQLDSVTTVSAPGSNTVLAGTTEDAQKIFAQSGLEQPITVKDLPTNADTKWLKVDVKVSTYLPGSVVYVAVTTQPVILGSVLVDQFGTANLTGYLPVNALPDGGHNIRVVGTRDLGGVSTDANGQVKLSDDTVNQINLFDKGTQATVLISGAGANGGVNTAELIVPLRDALPWWTLWVIVGAMLLSLIVAWRRRLRLARTRLIFTGVVVASYLPAFILGWVNSAYAVMGWGALLMIAGIAQVWFLSPVFTRKNEDSEASNLVAAKA